MIKIKYPHDVFPCSNKKVWWICNKNHEWKAMISNRTGNNNTGCPICKESKGEKFVAGILDILNTNDKKHLKHASMKNYYHLISISRTIIYA